MPLPSSTSRQQPHLSSSSVAAGRSLPQRLAKFGHARVWRWRDRGAPDSRSASGGGMSAVYTTSSAPQLIAGGGGGGTGGIDTDCRHRFGVRWRGGGGLNGQDAPDSSWGGGGGTRRAVELPHPIPDRVPRFKRMGFMAKRADPVQNGGTGGAPHSESTDVGRSRRRRRILRWRRRGGADNGTCR